MSTSELSIVEKLERSRLKVECEILAIRKEHFMKNVTKIDTDVYNTIKESNVSSAANEELVQKWQVLINEDKCKVDLKWKKKVDGMKSAYINDKEFLKNHQSVRIAVNNDSDLTFENQHDNEILSAETELEINNCDDDTSKNMSKNGEGKLSPQRHKYYLR